MVDRSHFRKKNRLSPGCAHGQWFWVPDPSSFDESSDMVLLSTEVLEPGPLRRTLLHCLDAVIDRDTDLSVRAKTMAKNAIYEYLAVAGFATVTFKPVQGTSPCLNSRRVSYPLHRYVAVPAHWIYITEGVGKTVGKVALDVLQRRRAA